jgi:c-di-GMP-binding flagellar brake protein YcgR
MYTDTQPAPLDAPGPAAKAGAGARRPRARGQAEAVDDRSAIVGLLRALRDRSVPISLVGPGGTAMRALLWSYDSAQWRLALAAEGTHPQLAQCVEGDDAVAVAYLDHIKLQFDLAGLTLVHGPTTSALQAAMPRVIWRFQRREAFRVRSAGRGPLARLRHPALPEMNLALRVLDLSIGGCALLLPADVPALEPGLHLSGVRIELDAETRLTLGLQLHHVSSLAGGQGTRLGCEWQQVDAGAQRALQRYIDLTQRRRRLLTA